MAAILKLMSRRWSLLALAAALSLLPAVNAAAPNVLILVADDLGWADVPWRGSPARMPNLDRLRQDGTELMRFYGAPLCSPSRAALYTGRSAAQLNIRDVFSGRDDGLGALEHLMPESFRAAGYQTALTGKWHLGSDSTHVPTARGFDHFYGFLGGAISYFTHVGESTTRVDWQRDGVTLNEPGYSTDLIRDEEIRLLRTRDPARPFFHVVTFNAPHIPLEAPTDLIANYPTLSGDAKTYAAMLESLDIAIGRILSELTAQRLDANTVVVFYSDNGGPGNSVARNTPLRGSKNGVYEGGIRVPAIIRQPGVIRAGVTTDQFTTVQDLFPTLTAATGVTPRNRLPLDGLNLCGHAAWRERAGRPHLHRGFHHRQRTIRGQMEIGGACDVRRVVRPRRGSVRNHQSGQRATGHYDAPSQCADGCPRSLAKRSEQRRCPRDQPVRPGRRGRHRWNTDPRVLRSRRRQAPRYPRCGADPRCVRRHRHPR
jgi:arylsulfatase A-like enzyme